MERVKQNEKEKQREWVLDYFIDPHNGGMEYENFSNLLLKTAVGSSDSPENEKILSKMSALFNELKDARRFNETYIGHMLSEASIPAIVAHMYATRLGSNSVAPEVSKLETKHEPEAIKFLLDIVGYDKDKASGTFTSGGSMAVFTALTVARKKIQERYEVEAKKKGLEANIPEPLFVFTTPMAHYCLHKALDFLGGQNRQIHSIPVATEGLKMSPQDLEQRIAERRSKGDTIMAVYAIAGETETGLVDPLEEIADVAEKYDIFTIADAAYGAPYRWSSKEKLFKGLPRFDAVVVDGHKALYTPYPNGAVLFKSANDHVLFGMGVDATYVQMGDDSEDFRHALLYKDRETGEPLDFDNEKDNRVINLMLGKKRPEGSGTAASILSTVATKRTLGEDGLRAVYEITLDRIDHLYERLEKSEWLKPFHKPDVNVLCFTLSEKAERMFGFPSNEKAKNVKRTEILEEVRQELNTNDGGKTIEGKTGYFLSSTDLPLDEIDKEETIKKGKEIRKKHYVLRAVLMNPRTTDAIIDDAVEKMESIIEAKLNITTS